VVIPDRHIEIAAQECAAYKPKGRAVIPDRLFLIKNYSKFMLNTSEDKSEMLHFSE
jgi:hypothetical protein